MPNPSIVVELLRSSCEGKKQHLSRLGVLGIHPSIEVELLRGSREATMHNLGRWWDSGNSTFRLWRGSCEATKKQRSSTLAECEFGDAHTFDCGGASSKQLRSEATALELLRSSREAWASPLRMWSRVYSGNSPPSIVVELLRSSRATQKQHLGRV